jgi:hypothetical protein
MTQAQIEKAQEEKRLYLATLLLTAGTRLLAMILQRTVGDSGPTTVLLVISGALLIVAIIVTWRFSRAIEIGRPMSTINAILCPVIFLVQIVFLLRIYSRRTGIPLTFLMGDRMPEPGMTRVPGAGAHRAPSRPGR